MQEKIFRLVESGVTDLQDIIRQSGTTGGSVSGTLNELIHRGRIVRVRRAVYGLTLQKRTGTYVGNGDTQTIPGTAGARAVVIKPSTPPATVVWDGTMKDKSLIGVRVTGPRGY